MLTHSLRQATRDEIPAKRRPAGLSARSSKRCGRGAGSISRASETRVSLSANHERVAYESVAPRLITLHVSTSAGFAEEPSEAGRQQTKIAVPEMTTY
jgi:hypothetical protein